MALLLSTVLYNLSHGPWDGSAWFRKLREGASEYWSKAEAGDPLPEVLYESLCLDFQEEAVGTPERKLQVLNRAVDSNVVRKKGEKVALRRWFSWIGASRAHDKLWHARLLFISAIGFSLGFWRSKEEYPWFAGPSGGKPATEKKEAATEKEEAAAAAQDTQPEKAAPAADDAEGGVKKGSEALAALRKRARNTLFLAVEVSCQPDLQRKCRILSECSLPVYNTHSENTREVRSPEATRDFYNEKEKVNLRWTTSPCIRRPINHITIDIACDYFWVHTDGCQMILRRTTSDICVSQLFCYKVPFQILHWWMLIHVFGGHMSLWVLFEVFVRQCSRSLH